MDAKKYEHILDPSSVLELGYAAHVADDPLTVGTKARLLASRLLDDFLAMRGIAGSDDEAYLFRARAIVLSLGRGITRRKLAYQADLAAADAYRKMELLRIDDQRSQSFWMNLTYRAAVSGGIGFALMESMLPFIHLQFQKNGGQVVMTGLAPSLLLALVFAAGSRVASAKMEDFRYRGILQHYEWLRLQAVHRYESGKLKEFERNNNEIRRIWREYTGRQPPRSVTFATVLADDIRTHEWIEQARRQEMAGITGKLMTWLQAWRDKRQKLTKTANKSETDYARHALSDDGPDRPHPAVIAGGGDHL